MTKNFKITGGRWDGLDVRISRDSFESEIHIPIEVLDRLSGNLSAHPQVGSVVFKCEQDNDSLCEQ